MSDAKRRRFIVPGLILLVASGLWLCNRTPPATPISPEKSPGEAPAVSPPVPVAPAAVIPPPPPPHAMEMPRRDDPRTLTSPLIPAVPAGPPPARSVRDAEPDLAADFEKISLMLRDYRTLNGENPVGTNAEIMKSIMGGNPRGAVLGPPEGMTVNGDGELLDRWGTPYFFHAITKDLMEIRSAGPDRRMWNEDDLAGE